MVGPDGQPARFFVLAVHDARGDAPLAGPVVLARARVVCESMPGSKIVTARQLATLRAQRFVYQS
jgi:hypothetical protein